MLAIHKKKKKKKDYGSKTQNFHGLFGKQTNQNQNQSFGALAACATVCMWQGAHSVIGAKPSPWLAVYQKRHHNANFICEALHTRGLWITEVMAQNTSQSQRAFCELQLPRILWCVDLDSWSWGLCWRHVHWNTLVAGPGGPGVAAAVPAAVLPRVHSPHCVRSLPQRRDPAASLDTEWHGWWPLNFSLGQSFIHTYKHTYSRSHSHPQGV